MPALITSQFQILRYTCKKRLCIIPSCEIYDGVSVDELQFVFMPQLFRSKPLMWGAVRATATNSMYLVEEGTTQTMAREIIVVMRAEFS